MKLVVMPVPRALYTRSQFATTQRDRVHHVDIVDEQAQGERHEAEHATGKRVSSPG